MNESPRLAVLTGVGETLRSLRAARGWTQDQLQQVTRAGGASGVSATAISRIERGDDVPNLSTVDRLLEALDVSFDGFLATWRQVRGESPVTGHKSGEVADEVFLVWRLQGALGREPKEVNRQVKDLVQLVREVRGSLDAEKPRESEAKSRGQRS